MGLFSFGLGLLGLASDRSARKRSDYNNSPQGIRANAEAAGFNPLAFVGPGTGTGAQYAPSFGSTLNQIGQGLTDYAIESRALDLQKQQLEQEKEQLEELRKSHILRPSNESLYGKRKNGKGNSGASGPDDASKPDVQLGAGLSDLAPGRDVEVAPVTSGSGITEINNALTGNTPVYVPGSDGEPWDIGEVITAAAFGGPQIAARKAYDAMNRTRDPGDRILPKDSPPKDFPKKPKNGQTHRASNGATYQWHERLGWYEINRADKKTKN